MKPKQIELSPEQATYHAVFQPVTTHSQEHIASLLADRPDAYLPENVVLDQIVDGTITFDKLRAEIGIDFDPHAWYEEPYCWFDSFLEAVDWWRELADVALESEESQSTIRCFGPRPQFAKHRKILSNLLREVLSTYVDAHEETSPYCEDWAVLGSATLEFLHRYRTFTKYIESFVLEVFPEINREVLLRPDFGFIDKAA